MRLGSFQLPRGPAYGAVVGEMWLDFAHAVAIAGLPTPPETLGEFLGLGPRGREVAEQLLEGASADPDRYAPALHARQDARYLPPIWSQPRLFTQRGNSCLFSRQIRLPVPEQPVFELRHSHNLVGHKAVHAIPPGITGGWNPELVAVIGKAGRTIAPERVLEHVAGYSLMIDHATGFPGFEGDWKVPDGSRTMRDNFFEQAHYSNAWAPVPVGPWLVTADEVGNPHDLWVTARENGPDISPTEQGRLIEKTHSSALLFTFQEALSFLSRFVTLRPGDMISSAAIGWDGYPYWDAYSPGAYVEAEAERIGLLRMYLVDRRGGEAG